MEAIRVDEPDVIDRLDAEYYQRKFVEADRRVRSFQPNLPIEKIWREYNRIYIGIAGFDDVDDPEHFTPYLRPTDIGLDGEIDYSSLPWCRKEWLEDHHKKGCGQPNDLIIEVKGNTRKVAVLDRRIPEKCIVSGSAYRLRLRKGHDPHFVQTYLLSPTGQLLKRRLVSNTAVSYIDPASFRTIRIPTPSFEAQAYIGAKVRQANTLRERARGLEMAFREVVGVVVARPAKPARFTRLPAVDIGADLNPGRYDPDRVEIQKQLLASGGVEIGSFGRIETPTAEPSTPTQPYLGLDGIQSDSVDLILDTVGAAGVTGTCRRLRPGAVISKLRPYLNKVAYISVGDSGAIGSTELLCVDDNGVHPGFS